MWYLTGYIMSEKPKIIVVIGPTASGKSALAVEIARKIGGEVISADSRQVYKGLNIGSGKISKKEMRGVPHHLLDVASPKKIYTAAHFKIDADRAIKKIISKGNVPIICGGTGFYVDTLLGKIDLPEAKPDAALRKTLSKKSAPELFSLLKKLDPRRAKEIDRNNPVRLIRAIEIAHALGRVPMLATKVQAYETLTLGISWLKEQLQKRIHDRLKVRMKQGMLREAKNLRAHGLSFKRMEELGLEYRCMARHLQGQLTKEEMLKQLELEIVRYAKRQMTWFKRDETVIWVSPKNKAKTLLHVARFLNS